jgi:hypothetical protein
MRNSQKPKEEKKMTKLSDEEFYKRARRLVDNAWELGKLTLKFDDVQDLKDWQDLHDWIEQHKSEEVRARLKMAVMMSWNMCYEFMIEIMVENKISTKEGFEEHRKVVEKEAREEEEKQNPGYLKGTGVAYLQPELKEEN